MRWLTDNFYEKSWYPEQSDPFHAFVERFGYKRFDDEDVQEVYLRFREAATNFRNWLANYGDWDGGPTFGLKDPHFWVGGHEAYYAERAKAVDMADEFVRMRSELEDVAREHGL